MRGDETPENMTIAGSLHSQRIGTTKLHSANEWQTNKGT